MATKQKKNMNSLVRCDHCGEYYAISNKRCPFCDEYDAYDAPDAEETPRRGGKRLATNTRGGGYGGGWTTGRVILTILSLAMIVAAACIVFRVIVPLVDKGKVSETPTPPVTVSPSEVPTPTPTPENPTPTPTPSPTPSQIPSTQTANGFTLNKSDFTLSKAGETYRIKATFSPAGTTGFIDWASSDTDVATVDEDGVVTGVGKGNATITATMAGGVTQKCIVRCTFSSGSSSTSTATPKPTSTPSSSSDFELSRADFTLSREGETYRIKVSGVSEESVGWSTSNSSVATVSSSGTVTAVGEGTCTITAAADGTTRKCIVRVNFD